MTTPDSDGSLFSAESYFGTQPPPPTLDDDIASVRSFVHRQRDLGRKVALVTVSAASSVLSLPAQMSLSQEWRDNCPIGAQRVSIVLPYLPIVFTKAHSIPPATPRVRFLDNFSAGGSLARASIVSSRFLNGLSCRRPARYSRCNICRVLP
jgi:hypothetical protein